MFVQVIEGHTRDAEGLRRQTDIWRTDLRPGAIGFVGATSGVTSDGRAITLVRFESEEAARANSERTEQGQWWSEMEKYYDGEASFTASSDITTWRAGGSDDAGFVQVMKFADADRALLDQMDAIVNRIDGRPDIIGGYRVWTSPSTCVEVAYFTSEAEARAGEQQGLPPEFDELGASFDQQMADVEFFDLTAPQLF